MTKNKNGFTLIELLIVIAIITILATAAIVGINPGQRFRAARNATRWSHMNSIATAIITYAAENNGAWPSDSSTDTCIGAPGVPVTIGTDPTIWCHDTGVSLLVPNYISTLPVPPLPGEEYHIEFDDAEETRIKITSTDDEATTEGVEVIR